MYSPFLDKKGNPLEIRKVKYEHLDQLLECDEGHHLEYKLLLEDGGKAQLAKEIASFANCEGGWLIVGIDDNSKQPCPIEKKDYSQKVGKIATRISPMPEFETRFLTTPNDRTKGVLLIYVYEGIHAPYICNGSVYVRSGSSKEPIPANRGNVEYLLERSKSYQTELERFCQRDYYFPYNDTQNKEIKYSISCVYLKNISQKKNTYLQKYANRDKLIEFIKNNQFGKLFESIEYSMNSIIFKHKSIYPSTYNATSVFELFYDWSCKIYLPMALTSDDDINKIRSFYVNIGIDNNIVNSFKLVNGITMCSGLLLPLRLFSDMAEKFELKEKDYAVNFEIENAAETILFFDNEKYKEYIYKYGLPYAHKEVNKSDIILLKEHPKVTFNIMSNTLMTDYLAATFGFRADCIWDIFANIE